MSEQPVLRLVPTPSDPVDGALVVRVVHRGDERSVVLVVSGDLDTMGAPALRRAWQATVVPPGCGVVLDMGATTFCSAAGLQVLAQVQRRCRDDGLDLRFVATGTVERLLRLVGLAPAGVPAPRVVSVPAPPARPGQTDGPTIGPIGVVPRPRWSTEVVGRDRVSLGQAVVCEAMATVPGIGSAQLTVPTGRRTRGSVGRAGPLGDRLADLEVVLGQGPGWQSHSERTDVEALDLQAAGSARRWPALVPAARDLPVRSVLCVHLGSRARSLGTLTVSAAHPGAFGAEARAVAGVLAAVASLVLGAEDDSRNLREALAHRDTIGQAKGILMERHRLTADEAFAVLRTASVESNTKLHVVAARVAETGAV